MFKSKKISQILLHMSTSIDCIRINSYFEGWGIYYLKNQTQINETNVNILATTTTKFLKFIQGSFFLESQDVVNTFYQLLWFVFSGSFLPSFISKKFLTLSSMGQLINR